MTKAKKKIPERKEYMDQLALSLAKPWAIKRLANSNLSRKVKYNIVNVFDLPTQPDESPKVTASDQQHIKIRCEVCEHIKDRKTRFRCVSCHKPVYTKHYYTLCQLCGDKL